MISENFRTFIVLKYKVVQTIIAILTVDKVTEIFFMADEFCKFFDRMTKKYTMEAPSKRKYHRNSTPLRVCKNQRIHIHKVFKGITQQKNIAQVGHSRHRCFDNFFINAMAVLAAYCCFPKKPAIQVVKCTDNQLTLF